MKLLPVILIILLLDLGCRKRFYEDETWSLKSTSKRLEGLWEITSIQIEGVEMIDTLKGMYDSCWGILRFRPEDSFTVIQGQNCFPYGSYKVEKSGSVQLAILNNKWGTGSGTLSDSITASQFAIVNGQWWRIKKLTKGDFAAECTYQLKIQRFEARKIASD